MITIFSDSKNLFVLGFILLLMSTNVLAIESPKYTVVYQDELVEYRQYEPYIVAETFVENSSSYRAASNEGFMRLFRYITGGNSSQLDIDMTAPVQQTAANEEIAMTAPVQRVETPEGWSVAFMLPTKIYNRHRSPAHRRTHSSTFHSWPTDGSGPILRKVDRAKL